MRLSSLCFMHSLVIVGLVSPVPIRAQDVTPVAPMVAHPDSTPEAAAASGRQAANRRATGGRFIGGFAGGFLGGLIGTGVVYAIAAGSDASPPTDEQARLAASSPSYRTGFETAYRDRLRSRRKQSALLGGVLGTALIVTILMSQSN